MRILYAIMAYGPHIIASEVHSELGRAFRQQGHSFSVVSPADYAEAGEAGAKPFPDEADQVKVYSIEFKNSLWRRIIRKICRRVFKYAFFLDLYWGFRRFLREHQHKFDIVHVEAAYPLGAAIALASRKLKLPFVVTLQGADVMNLPKYDYGYGRFWLPRQLLRYTFKWAAGVRANSEQTAAIALAMGANPAKVKPILRNISDNIFEAANQKHANFKAENANMLREKYNLNEGAIIIALSRLHPFKGLDFLIRAAPLLREKIGKVNILICGPSRKTPQFGDYRQYLERLADELGVRDMVTFTGKVDFAHSQDYLAGADLLVVPSVVEALNKVVTEAAAVGTPSVITETTGIATHAVAAGIAISVKPSDSTSLAESIIAALITKETLGANGATFAARFTSAKIAAELLEFYHQTLVSVLRPSSSALCYVAYPSSLTLKSANAIQTFNTCRELKKLAPKTLILLPRLPFRPSHFTQIGAKHLLRLPFNFFNNFAPLKAFPWTYAERAWFSFNAGLYLLWHKLTGRGVQVIYVRDVICAYLLIKYWRKILGVKVIYEVHDLEQRNPSRARSARWRKWLEKVDRTVIGKSDGLVSLTGAFLEFAQAEGLLPKLESRPCRVIPDAFDAEVYRPMATLECRQQRNIALEQFVLVYSGMTFAYRNLDKLIEAFANFLKAHPHTQASLYLVGGRPFEQKEMQAVAAKLGLSDLVICVGQKDAETVNLYLNAASLLAIPDTVTDVTASPLKMFEYAAVGRPVLLPDIPALKEILSEDEAVYFPRGDVIAMTEAITWVYQHPEQAAQKGVAAHQRVQAHTYQNRAKAILELTLVVSGQ